MGRPLPRLTATSDGIPFSELNIYRLDNRKIGWGLRRAGNSQPEVPRAWVEALDRFGALFMGCAHDKSIYLTFDAGYENGYTAKILDALLANGVKGTFFITGSYLDRNPDLVRRMIDEGHIIGNHSDRHPSLPGVSYERVVREIVDVNDRFYEKFGLNMTYFRPPNGEISERVLAITAREGYRTVMWSLAYLDYDVNNQRGEEFAYRMLMDNLHSGAIILLHTVSRDNANVMDRFLRDAIALGYTFKSLDDFSRQS